MFDTHAHLYDSRFIEEGKTPEMVLNQAAQSGVDRILIPADSIETSRAALEYCTDYNGISGIRLFGAIGVHPHEAKDYDSISEEYLSEKLASPSRRDSFVYALGEIGLDYHYDLSPRDIQREVMRHQLILAYEYKIPIILHEREATGDCLGILKEFYSHGNLYSNPGVCHCCSMSSEAASELLKMGFYLGFDGPITFKNNRKTVETLLNCPLERIVVETDSPYLTPEPNRGIINEPAHVGYVLRRIAELKNIDEHELIVRLSNNSIELLEI